MLYHRKKDEEKVVKKTQEFFEELSKHNVEDLVALDEMGINNELTKAYGRGKGRVYEGINHKPKIKKTVIAGLSISGLVAPFEFDGYIDGEFFCYYLENILIPDMREEQVLILDNLSSHKVSKVKEILEQKHIKVIYLPPYSPELNPIELLWAFIKHYLRKWKARTKNSLEEALSKAISILTKKHILSFFNQSLNMSISL